MPWGRGGVWGLAALLLILFFSGSDLSAEDRSPSALELPASGSSNFWPVELTRSNDSFPKIHLNGEGGLAIFDTEAEGQFPNNEFRVDEMKLFVEAAVYKDIYVFGELNLLTRETNEESLKLGELYMDFENVSKLWDAEGVLNVRFGRFDIPFGEEYLKRDAIDNPLISHSLSDLWGVDEGIQVYGTIKKVQYNLAIQNGSEPLFQDSNSDKSITGRVGYDPFTALHVSFSAMRTGDLDVEGDKLSELWFGNGFIRAIGSASTFHAELIQGDGQVKWKDAHFFFGIGHLNYDDDSATENKRDAFYYQLEGLKSIHHQNKGSLYICARYSRIESDNGFPLVGHGDFGSFFFNNALLTRTLWRFSVGPGYRIGNNALIKAEYTMERGHKLNGEKREDENFWGAEVALKF